LQGAIGICTEGQLVLPSQLGHSSSPAAAVSTEWIWSILALQKDRQTTN